MLNFFLSFFCDPAVIQQDIIWFPCVYVVSVAFYSLTMWNRHCFRTDLTITFIVFSIFELFAQFKIINVLFLKFPSALSRHFLSLCGGLLSACLDVPQIGSLLLSFHTVYSLDGVVAPQLMLQPSTHFAPRSQWRIVFHGFNHTCI